MFLKEGFYPVHCAHSFNEARRLLFSLQPDLMVISTPLPDEQGTDLVYDAHEKTSTGMVVFARPRTTYQYATSLEQTRALILPKLINRLTLLQTVRFALSVRKPMAEQAGI